MNSIQNYAERFTKRTETLISKVKEQEQELKLQLLVALVDETGLLWEDVIKFAKGRLALVGGPSVHKAPPEPKSQSKSQPQNVPEDKSKGKRLTAQTRQAIKNALLKGEKGVEVARKFGISYPTLHAIKTEAGLVKSRK